MTTCDATTTVDGKTVDCEHEAGHKGKHEGHVPEDGVSGLLWELHAWE